MRKFLKFILILIVILSVILSVFLYFVYKRLLPYKEIEIDETIISAQMNSGATKLYAYDFYDRENRRGKEYVLEDFSVESKESYIYCDLDKIPKDLINAFIAIEDKRFYKHNGVDFLRTGKAGLNYILKKSSSFGGSTITQQLVKNITGNSEKSIDRKVKEIFYAINLERRYTKDEIMGMYLNIINLGNRCRGVGAAAKFYFSKDVSQLTLSECATIAAITNNPSYYNPVTNIKNTQSRRDLILRCMLESSFITEETYNSATKEDIYLKLSQKHTGKINSWYTDMVIEDVIYDLVTKYNLDRDAASNIVYNGKLKIYTAMDEDIQILLEDYYRSLKIGAMKSSTDEALKSSFIVIDSKTGDILGLVGDIGEKQGNRIQSFATGTKRPSGSAIKPLSVYAPALDKGIIKWSSIYSDTFIEENNGRQWPQNACGKYIGDTDIQYAIANSLNTVSVKVLRDLGINESFDFLKNKLNFTGLEAQAYGDVGDMCDSSLALGQHKTGITLKELTAGYTVFDGGVYRKPRSYFKVTDSDGKVLLENEAYSQRAISKESAAIMTKLLQSVVKEGTAKNKITVNSKVEVAGKTGTTSNNCDRYFVGFTPDIVGGCWVGYEYPEKINVAGNPAINIWDDIFSKIYALSQYKDARGQFYVPDSIEELSYDKTTGEMPNLYSIDENIKSGWFVK